MGTSYTSGAVTCLLAHTATSGNFVRLGSALEGSASLGFTAAAAGSMGRASGSVTCLMAATGRGMVADKSPVPATTLYELGASYRSYRLVSTPYGVVREYTHRFACPKGMLDTVLTGDLALGAKLQGVWMTDPDLYNPRVEGPRVQQVTVQQDPKSAKEVLDVVFQGVVLLHSPCVGYNETRRTEPRKIDAFRSIVETWGVALSENGWDVPTRGTWLDDDSSDPLGYRCDSVEARKGVLEGRVVFHAVWSDRRPQPDFA